ncbi:MAG: hypothetical protein Q8R82_07090 [Hyphomonadaceae bacterium]|nr:hypothetical protein [Hyphomonadaceae bacterium]
MRVEFPSGVGACAIADPGAPGRSTTLSFRVLLGNACDDEGILAEMERKLPAEKRLPWRDRESHAWAITQLERGPYPGMSEEEQRAAVQYVRETAYYE